MDLFSVVSGALSPFRHKKLGSPLLDAFDKKALLPFFDCFADLVQYGKETSDFANNNCLAGKYHVFCTSSVRQGASDP
jgi:hypothetical protein